MKLSRILEQANTDIEGKIATFERTLQALYPEIRRVGLYFDRSNNSIFLSDLYIKPEHRGQGIGTKVMNGIIEFADSIKLPIVLVPEPEDDNISQRKLMDFYKRFGFVINKGKHKDFSFSDPYAATMYRLPRS